jgi:hypothetical protein
MGSLYKIVTVAGFTLAADGMDYVVLSSDGTEVFRGHNKVLVEAKMRELIKAKTA